MRALEGLLEAVLGVADFVVELVLDLLLASCKRIDLPACLEIWIDREMPAVRGVRHMNIYCCDAGDLPLGPIVNAEDREGITLGDHVCLSKLVCPFDACDARKVKALLHELAHVEQNHTNAAWTVRYVVEYLLRLVRLKLAGEDTADAYWSHPEEIAARARADELSQRYVSENPCGCAALRPSTAQSGAAAERPVPAK